MEGLVIFWTDHALERAGERLPGASSVAPFRRAVESVVEARDWIEYYEIDPRENRGLRTNFLVHDPKTDTYAVVRRHQGGYIVASVLTAAQVAFNAKMLWSRTPEEARARARAGSAPEPLKHSPFAALGRRK